MGAEWASAGAQRVPAIVLRTEMVGPRLGGGSGGSASPDPSMDTGGSEPESGRWRALQEVPPLGEGPLGEGPQARGPFIPDLAEEAFMMVGGHAQPFTPGPSPHAQLKQGGCSVTSAGVNFSWRALEFHDSPGPAGSRVSDYFISVTGSVTEGLAVSCTCPQGAVCSGLAARAAEGSDTGGPVPVCKHAHEALLSVLDPEVKPAQGPHRVVPHAVNPSTVWNGPGASRDVPAGFSPAESKEDHHYQYFDDLPTALAAVNEMTAGDLWQCKTGPALEDARKAVDEAGSGAWTTYKLLRWRCSCHGAPQPSNRGRMRPKVRREMEEFSIANLDKCLRQRHLSLEGSMQAKQDRLVTDLVAERDTQLGPKPCGCKATFSLKRHGDGYRISGLFKHNADCRKRKAAGPKSLTPWGRTGLDNLVFGRPGSSTVQIQNDFAAFARKRAADERNEPLEDLLHALGTSELTLGRAYHASKDDVRNARVRMAGMLHRRDPNEVQSIKCDRAPPSPCPS